MTQPAEEPRELHPFFQMDNPAATGQDFYTDFRPLPAHTNGEQAEGVADPKDLSAQERVESSTQGTQMELPFEEGKEETAPVEKVSTPVKAKGSGTRTS